LYGFLNHGIGVFAVAETTDDSYRVCDGLACASNPMVSPLFHLCVFGFLGPKAHARPNPIHAQRKLLHHSGQFVERLEDVHLAVLIRLTSWARLSQNIGRRGRKPVAKALAKTGSEFDVSGFMYQLLQDPLAPLAALHSANS